MPRKRKKPEFDSTKITQEYIKQVAEFYLNSDVSLRKVAEAFNITILKARKILITAGVYESEISEQVCLLHTDGKTNSEIQQIMKLSRASVHSYLPYSKIVYNCDEISTGAERTVLYRERKAVVTELKKALEENKSGLEPVLWNTLQAFQGYPFQTVKGMKFSYQIKGDELFVSRKEKTITRATVNLALQKVLEQERYISGPKKMDCSGASYLYTIFERIGVLIGK